MLALLLYLVLGALLAAGCAWGYLQWRLRTRYFVPEYLTTLRALVDTVCDVLYAVGLLKVPTVEGIVRGAQEAAGSSAVGDDFFRLPLHNMIECTYHVEGVTSFQRFAVEKWAQRELVTRIRLNEAIARQPSIVSRGVGRVVFVVGPPRIGSTFIHNVLQQDPGVRTPLQWELRYPFPERDEPDTAASRQRRIEKARMEHAFTARLYPLLEAMHLTKAEEADECYQGWQDCVFAPYAFTCFGWDKTMKKVSDFFMEQDMTTQYENYYRLLCHLRWLDGDADAERVLVLKSPMNSYHMEEIMRVFPHAAFLSIHRDPCSVVGSFAKLMEFCHTTLYVKGPHTAVERSEFGRAAVRLIQRSLECSARARANHPGRHWYDIQFKQLVTDTIPVLRHQVYAPLGMHWSETGERAIVHFLKERSKAKRKPNAYDLARYGLTKDSVRASFSDYVAKHNL
eukprot:TRINITY_DN7695_c0_g1_i1.p1 TRINITY_DN7695_c0_g1~~TRINITY_DN7695_c0_g1_i1.p1  ORF type:complete len:453 (+),score=165.41 TRINITY_DN7695_c0_g1_i1:375-1733(+)